MRHEWERGMTVDTPHAPAEGYSYCAYCSTEENDDNTTEECPARFGFKPLTFDRESFDVNLASGGSIGALYRSTDFQYVSKEDDARYDREAELYGQLFAVSPELLLFAKDASASLCSAICPTVWKSDEPQPHHPLCQRGRALIERAEYNPFCEECGGSGECEYALPGFSADLEQSTETAECQTCGGTGRRPQEDATQPASA